MTQAKTDDPTKEGNRQQGDGQTAPQLELIRVDRPEQLPFWAGREELEQFFHHEMKPFNDELPDVHEALNYAFSSEAGKGGYIILAAWERKLAGALLMLNTAMSGYVPSNLLLFVVVDPTLRGKGLGRQIINRAISECEGDVKLHVESDNPAKRLYTRMGFVHKYDEMRFSRS